ncbi:phosphotransferase family protein [Actinokineospora sp. UTMC 2448]|uniref:phosphotransferase family protein n=1 Tax=Actinokineospora sp. UTMC 2448 TaxID=2268449 RepID=UPI002164D911|nr:aminoglycoside phosphotransferase family protein [Actinokineospora sp. UTMC 2448]UVS77545.1 hypothetical protein Actkin_01258 [Actinokineospora sp. UTMC 2448]
MPAKLSWDDLPGAVRLSVERHAGPISVIERVVVGQSSDITCVLHLGDSRRVFLKGVRGRRPAMRWLRNETAAARHVVGIAPEVLFSEDVAVDGDDWLVVGFEHVSGRPADLSPGSPDLAPVAQVVERIAEVRAPDLRPLTMRWPETHWWRDLAVAQPEAVHGLDPARLDALSAELPALVDGDRLVHTDLHGDQFLLCGPSARVIDWGMPGRGAAWVDTAYLIVRLIERGHFPAEAESWARSRGTWSADAEAALTPWAVYLAGMWTSWVRQGRCTATRAALAQRYMRWRLGT